MCESYTHSAVHLAPDESRHHQESPHTGHHYCPQNNLQSETKQQSIVGFSSDLSRHQYESSQTGYHYSPQNSLQSVHKQLSFVRLSSELSRTQQALPTVVVSYWNAAMAVGTASSLQPSKTALSNYPQILAVTIKSCPMLDITYTVALRTAPGL